jgi:antitoxin VapB
MIEKTVEIVETAEGQTVLLPKEFHINAPAVWIRRDGNLLILEPVKPATLPEGFWDEVHIDDPKFERPDQGTMPPAPVLD